MTTHQDKFFGNDVNWFVGFSVSDSAFGFDGVAASNRKVGDFAANTAGPVHLDAAGMISNFTVFC